MNLLLLDGLSNFGITNPGSIIIIKAINITEAKNKHEFVFTKKLKS
jgi:hypothetical protein